jgi:hypothetical protein
MQELTGLPANRFDDARVGVPGRYNCYSGVEIEESVPVDVFDDGALAPLDNERVAAGVGGRNYIPIAGNNFGGLRAW